MLPPLQGEGKFWCCIGSCCNSLSRRSLVSLEVARYYCLANARSYVRSAGLAVFTQLRLAVRNCGGNTYKQTENIKVCLYSTLCKINSHNHSYLQYHGGAEANGA